VRAKLLDGGMLWFAWLRSPRQVGAVAPSGVRLASAMAGEVPPGPGIVLELGGGTGSITAGPAVFRHPTVAARGGGA
jgi:phospholipid N-methyltransferase